jgi:uncharacterized protein YdbL (DUF1318 family)
MMTKRLGPALMSLFLTACVTINIYFPAAEAKEAAEKIVDDILQSAPVDVKPAPAGDGQGALPGNSGQFNAFAVLLDLLLPAAHAAAPNFSVDSPQIRRIQAELKQRHPRLAPFYRSGAIGFTEDGKVAIRDAKAVSLRERKSLEKLVAADNGDRDSLYQAIARANGHPEWEAEVRAVFAKTWVEKAEKGWWYRKPNGQWMKK